MKRVILSFYSLFFFVLCSIAQTSLPQYTIVTQTFNSIGNSPTATLPLNWKMSSPNTGITSGWTTGTNVSSTTYEASSGLPNSSGAYNWATSAGIDRSIGFLPTTTSPQAIMAYFRNTTGASVSSVTIGYVLERYVINTAPATVELYYSTNGTAWTLVNAASTLPTDFPSGSSAGSFSAPKTINRTATISVTLAQNADIYFKWVFTTGNAVAQGLGLDNVSVFAGTATPVLTATLQDLLQVDNGTPNQFNEGDVIRYKTVIKNTGTGDANNVQVTLPTPPSNTTMVPGSIKTSAVGVDDSYNASFNTALIVGTVGAGVLNNDVGIPTPTAVLSYGTTADATLVAPGAGGTTDAGGTITLNANGTFTYTPPANFSGADKFKYITGNGNLPNNDAIVTINVAADITISTTNIDPSCNGGSNGSITFNASGGNGTLQYSITGAAGTYQASNVFTGLSAGTYNLAVKDAGGYIKTGATTLNNPLAIVVNGPTPLNLTYTTAMSNSTYTRTNGTGASTWSATGLPAGLSINTSTGDVTGTPSVTGTFNATINVLDVNSCTGSKSIMINVAPKLTNDSYTAVGNTQLVSDAHSSPTTPFTTSATNILGNDQSNAAITVTAGTFATTGGGSITIAADGKFTYSPPNGSTAADSYTYTATSNGVSATATINFTISNMVWYVNNTYGGGSGAANGSSHRPYTDLTSASAAAAVNQIIYVHTGSGNTSGNATLKNSQTLRGAGSTLSVGALSLLAGVKPTLSGTVTLASSVTVDGFDMSTGTLTALTNAGTSVTGVTVNIGTVTTTTGIGISLTGTGNNVSITLASLTTNGAANAVNLTGTAGSVTINAGSLTGGAGAVVNINGGTVSLTYSGSASQATAAQPLVSVSNGHTTGTVLFQTGTLSATNGTGLQFDNADGTYNFFGTTTLNGGDAGIDILNGSGGTFNFATTSGSIALTSPSGIAFNVGGTANTATINYDGNITQGNNVAMVSVTNHSTNAITFSTGNTLNATNGTGLQFDNADGNYNFNGTTTLNGGDAGIDILNGSAGTFTFPSTTSITNPTGTVITINASSANVTYSGTFSKSSAGTGILVNGETGGTITINGTGTKTLSTSTGNAVSLTSNTGATINFSGNNLALTTTSGIGLNATGGGTVSIIGTGNTISATTGSALNIVNTTIGANDITFQSISANGAANGIVLNNTGSSGEMYVTGVTTSGSGGTIQNTTSHAIVLNSTKTPSFTFLNINNTAGDGLNANALTAGFTITNCQITNIGNGDNDNGMTLVNVSGTVGIQGSSINNVAEEMIEVSSTSTQVMTMNVGTVTACTFTQPNTIAAIRGGGSFAGNGILFTSSLGSNYTVNISNSIFTDIKLSGFQFGSSGTSTGNNNNVNLTNNQFLVTITNALGNANNRSNGINIQGLNTIDIDVSIVGNTLNKGGGGGIQLGADNTSTIDAELKNNTISNQFADGILMGVDESATLTVLVDGNNITNTSSDGMEISNAISPDALSAKLYATITNNTINGHNSNVGGNSFVGGIAVFGGANASDITLVNITGNSVSGNPSPGTYADYWIDGSSFGDMILLQGGGTAAVLEADFLAAPPPQNTTTAPAGGKTFIGNTFYSNGTTVPLPVLTP